jgi:hypothetical protein
MKGITMKDTEARALPSKTALRSWAVVVGFLAAALALPVPARAQAEDKKVGNKAFVIGPKIRAGGRFDNVRMCVASPAGAKGGPAADISVSTEVALSDTLSLDIDLPVFRPVMFGVAFDMLQFEPSVTLKFRRIGNGRTDLVGGPTLGISLHYGPDYKSESSGDGRTNSFFAMGPLIGGYVGLDFKRPCKKFNLQLGVTPYVEPLFGVNDAQNHRGVVVGGLLDLQLRFGKPNPAE